MLEMCTSALCCHYVMCDISWRSHLAEITLHLFTISYCPTALSRFASPSPLLRTAVLVYGDGEDVEMFLTRWRCKLLQICRHLVSRHGIASLASWIFLLPGQSPLMVFCVDFYNTIWSYSQWDPVLPCPRMAQCSQCTLYSLWELGAKYLMDTKEVVLFSLLKVDRNPAKNFINTWTKQY